ncbi:MAG: hypothetical protein GY747_06895 [Planctomycetes bacterium]|nr:hypothetical protein [Planctomycetota bacterium]MCP4772460.1 hypothetical protein [Planctomycetota bacterium]
MSLAPQRPNFVLVWIGIVLLTLSFLSNFLAGGDGMQGLAPEGRVGHVANYVVDDSLTLPDLSEGAEVIAEESGFRIVSDPLAMEPHQLDGDFFPPMADQKEAIFGPDGLKKPVDFPVELLEEADKEDLPSVVKGVRVHEGAEDSGINHALRPAVGDPGQQGQPTEATASSDRPHQNSMYGGSGGHLSSALGKFKKNQDRPGFGAKVKARILGSNKGGRILVSFMIDNPNGKDLLPSQLAKKDLSPRLVAKARNLLEAVENLDEESDSEESVEEQHSKREWIENARRRELTRMLRLHPGGIEIIAEMTPAQLRALANKLDARSPRLRALLN